VPIPVPLPMFSFTGTRGSFMGDAHFYGKQVSMTQLHEKLTAVKYGRLGESEHCLVVTPSTVKICN
jgi:hypothetical protein